MAHEEFPPLTEQAKRVLISTQMDIEFSRPNWNRRFAAAVIREAVRQASTFTVGTSLKGQVVEVVTLNCIADDLHALPPVPPTREQMEEALQHLIDMYGARVAGELTDEHLQTLRAGIAHHCKVQP